MGGVVVSFNRKWLRKWLDELYSATDSDLRRIHATMMSLRRAYAIACWDESDAAVRRRKSHLDRLSSCQAIACRFEIVYTAVEMILNEPALSPDLYVCRFRELQAYIEETKAALVGVVS